MRISPLLNAGLYFIIGSLFLYFAIDSVEDTVLNPLTLLLTAVATLDYGITIRLINLHFRIKRHSKNKK
ncbi:YdiK family protein [Amphibacillus sediminis]|uniref:YdiK family protein n=1 Tax=Amphibacillus sediminis TaxID=360185 RepID=UPI000830FC09|nr:YdiK family protein [Amphibacillus sediminis]